MKATDQRAETLEEIMKNPLYNSMYKAMKHLDKEALRKIYDDITSKEDFKLSDDDMKLLVHDSMR